MIHILQSFIESLSNLKGDEKKAHVQKKDKDDEEEDKKEGKKNKRKPEEKKGGDKKDRESGKEKVNKTKRGDGSRHAYVECQHISFLNLGARNNHKPSWQNNS